MGAVYKRAAVFREINMPPWVHPYRNRPVVQNMRRRIHFVTLHLLQQVEGLFWAELAKSGSTLHVEDHPCSLTGNW